VFLAYSTALGTAFIDRELFLPEEWAADPVRREAAGVPKDKVFLTKPQLALLMLERALEAGIEAAWVAGDCLYSSSKLRRTLEQRQQAYVLAVSSAFLLRFFGQEGLRQAKVRELFSELPTKAWQQLSAGQGSKGERRFITPLGWPSGPVTGPGYGSGTWGNTPLTCSRRSKRWALISGSWLDAISTTLTNLTTISSLRPQLPRSNTS